MRKVSITLIEGPEKGLTHTFSQGSLTLGRAKADIILSDKKVSSKHCEISIESNGVWLIDHQSTNGTFIGGRKVIDKTLLKNLDEITVGLTRISVALVDDIVPQKNDTGPLDLDDISSVDDDVVDGLLDEASMPLKTQTKTGQATAAPAPAKEVVLPSQDAVYRDTGIQRIDHLISDELNTVSKWDQPSSDATNSKGGAVPRVKVTLNPRRGPEGITTVVCSQAVTSFGRKDVDIRLNDLDVSRKHAALEIVNGEKVFVRDLASTNGTYVNGKKISYQEVKTGDLLQVGQSIFEVSIEGGS